MPTPTNRTPVRVARGTIANLTASAADIQEGEICYATDEDKLYVKEGGALVSTSVDISVKADLDSPALTGTPTAPTATAGTNTTQVATTEFVTSAVPSDSDIDTRADDRITAAVGTTVQAYDAALPAGGDILVDGDIGVNVQAYDANLPAGSDILTASDVGVTVQAYDANAVGTGSANTWTAVQSFDGGVSVDGYYQQDDVNVGSGTTFDMLLGNFFTATYGASNVTLTFSNPPPAGVVHSFTILFFINGGSVTWPATVQWPDNNTAPTINQGKVNLFTFVTANGGSTWLGASLVDYL